MPPQNALHTSVPPEVELTGSPAATCSSTQVNRSGASGDPVLPIARSDKS
ncbi:Uncharacterised protein [Mycobacteroides abscessus subsp. abscessus]|nr:Uncharacterised protein [Mycobacteroides abscessus subsp. abscessus]